MENIKDNNDEYNLFAGIMNSWCKYDYLNGDSVYKRQSHYNYVDHECFKGDENGLHLFFVDDELYDIRIVLRFSGSKYEKSMDNYNELITILKNKFTKWEAFDIINENTKEHIGESYIFIPILEVEKDPTKFNQISISYKCESRVESME